eukprot:gene42012-66200_t
MPDGESRSAAQVEAERQEGQHGRAGHLDQRPIAVADPAGTDGCVAHREARIERIDHVAADVGAERERLGLEGELHAQLAAARREVEHQQFGPVGAVEHDVATETQGDVVEPPAADTLPISDYESLAAIHVVERLRSMSPDEIELIRRFEVAHRSRRTILAKIDQLQ